MSNAKRVRMTKTAADATRSLQEGKTYVVSAEEAETLVSAGACVVLEEIATEHSNRNDDDGEEEPGTERETTEAPPAPEVTTPVPSPRRGGGRARRGPASEG
jgi:hypothetical protein